jgi:hypothetical protein
MSTLSDYIDSVRWMVRDSDFRNYVFEDEELTPFINTAVRTFSKYRSKRKPYTLSLQPSQGQYTLPSDWITVDKESFDRTVHPSPEVDFAQYASFVLPNINNNMELQNTNFDWYDSDQFVIVTPTPMYSANLTFAYITSHTVDDDHSTIPDINMDFVCYLAAAEALKVLSVDKGSKMQKYKIGSGLSIDDSEIPNHLMAIADKYEGIFHKNIVSRPYGVSG